LPFQWLNLAQIRQIKPGDVPGKIVVIYDTGEFDLFDGTEAQLLLSTLEQTSYIDAANVAEPVRQPPANKSA